MIRFRPFSFHNIFAPILCSAIAVCIGELLINVIYFGEWKIFPGEWEALTGNILILFCFLEILFALTGRLYSALAIIIPLYGIVILSNILKLICFDNPLRPTDVQYLSDLRVVARSSFNSATILLLVLILAALLWLNIFLWKRKSASLSNKSRICAGILAGVALVLTVWLPSSFAVRNWLAGNGFELPESWQFIPRDSARANGLLVDMALSAVDPSFSRPEPYNRAEIERVAKKYSLSPQSRLISNSEPPPNIILIAVESFMDPLDLGVRFTSDPIPNFHRISREGTSRRDAGVPRTPSESIM
jgi:hypothetical protein